VGGSIESRLVQVADIYGFEPVMPLERAVSEARARVRALHLEIETDAQAAALRRQSEPWLQRLFSTVTA
jgi:hypothetical protein